MHQSHNLPLLMFIVLVAVTALVMLLRMKGERKRRVVHRTTTRLQVSMKLMRPPGIPTGFPTLRIASNSPMPLALDELKLKATRHDGKESVSPVSFSAGMPIAPEPGTEIRLDDTFSRLVGDLCDTPDGTARIKYGFVAQYNLAGMKIPVEEPQRNAILSAEGLKDT